MSVRGEGGKTMYHEERCDDPVEDDAEEDLHPEGLLPQNPVQRFVPHITQDGIHHDQQPDC